jgi:hypothetical protein
VYDLTLDDIHRIATMEFDLSPKTLSTGRSYWISQKPENFAQRVFRISHDAKGKLRELKLAVSSLRAGHNAYLTLPIKEETLRRALAAELSLLDSSFGGGQGQGMDVDHAFVRSAITPVNGQYIRPWMTRSPLPLKARVFTVGFNPKNPYLSSCVAAEEYVTALMNRNGKACGQFHERMTGMPSRTRRNIDAFVDLLESRGVQDVLQTNAVCYATADADELKKPAHRRGHLAGRAVFEKLLRRVQPRVLVVFGRNTVAELKRAFGPCFAELEPCSAKHQHEPCELLLPSFYSDGSPLSILSIRSLALPGYNVWHSWADEHLDLVADRVEGLVSKS